MVLRLAGQVRQVVHVLQPPRLKPRRHLRGFPYRRSVPQGVTVGPRIAGHLEEPQIQPPRFGLGRGELDPGPKGQSPNPPGRGPRCATSPPGVRFRPNWHKGGKDRKTPKLPTSVRWRPLLQDARPLSDRPSNPRAVFNGVSKQLTSLL